MSTGSGWEQPAVPVAPTCPHFGLVLAVLELARHPVGHAWRCACGSRFVVVRSDSGRKAFAPHGDSR